MKKDKEFTAYCGLYCRDCIPSNQQLFSLAEKLREQLDESRFEKYAELKGKKDEVFNDYQIFRKVLTAIIQLRCHKTCINNGGNPNCRIRECVNEKGIEGCWECPDFEDCELLEPLSIYHGDTPKRNLRLIKKYGVENWTDKRGKHYIWDK
ncbi:MAG: DUF3795 domain-containing protein [Candidatus Freyarchaeum deiterrae]